MGDECFGDINFDPVTVGGSREGEKKKGSGAFRATASGILTVGSVCMRSNERRQLSLPELVDPPTQLLLPQQGFWRVVALEIPTEGRVNLGLVCVWGGFGQTHTLHWVLRL